MTDIPDALCQVYEIPSYVMPLPNLIKLDMGRKTSLEKGEEQSTFKVLIHVYHYIFFLLLDFLV